MKRELPIPPDADSAARPWKSSGVGYWTAACSAPFFPTIWKDDPGTWGMLLADAANHIADAVAEDTGQPRHEVYERLCEVLMGELRAPSAKHEGSFVEKRQGS